MTSPSKCTKNGQVTVKGGGIPGRGGGTCAKGLRGAAKWLGCERHDDHLVVKVNTQRLYIHQATLSCVPVTQPQQHLLVIIIICIVRALKVEVTGSQISQVKIYLQNTDAQSLLR